MDWLDILGNALWIAALALALAGISFASWQASTNGNKLRAQLGQSSYMRLFNLAGVLFCAGLALTASAVFQMILWSVLGVAFAIAFVFQALHLENRKSKG